MSWIKLDKDLLTDPRLLRLARALQGRYEMTEVTAETRAFVERNAGPLPGVTTALGALAQLWMIADTHIGQDDILPLGAHEIDQIVGIAGFCELLPADWLEILDSDRVKLPDFHTHNGTTAKARAQGNRRVAEHRDRRKRKSVSDGNAKPLPDQTKTRPDQDLDQIEERPRERPPTFTDGNLVTLMKAIREVYPSGIWPEADWLLAERQIDQLVANFDATPSDLVDGARRYAAQCTAVGRSTQFVRSPIKFFSLPGRLWCDPYPTPTPDRSGGRKSFDDYVAREQGVKP